MLCCAMLCELPCTDSVPTVSRFLVVLQWIDFSFFHDYWLWDGGTARMLGASLWASRGAAPAPTNGVILVTCDVTSVHAAWRGGCGRSGRVWCTPTPTLSTYLPWSVRCNPQCLAPCPRRCFAGSQVVFLMHVTWSVTWIGGCAPWAARRPGATERCAG